MTSEEQVVVEFTHSEAVTLWQATGRVPLQGPAPFDPSKPIHTAETKLRRAIRDYEERVRLRSIREDEA